MVTVYNYSMVREQHFDDFDLMFITKTWKVNIVLMFTVHTYNMVTDQHFDRILPTDCTNSMVSEHHFDGFCL